ncbi:Hypothetical predicted protein, partial [Marmota monax]
SRRGPAFSCVVGLEVATAARLAGGIWTDTAFGGLVALSGKRGEGKRAELCGRRAVFHV